jgi:hypothetical protein
MNPFIFDSIYSGVKLSTSVHVNTNINTLTQTMWGTFNFTKLKYQRNNNLNWFSYIVLRRHYKYNNSHATRHSVNTLRIVIKRKACDIRSREETFFDISSTKIDTVVPSLYQCAKTRTLKILTVVSANSVRPFQPFFRQRNLCLPGVLSFTWQTLLTVNRKHFYMHILCI